MSRLTNHSQVFQRVLYIIEYMLDILREAAAVLELVLMVRP